MRALALTGLALGLSLAPGPAAAAPPPADDQATTELKEHHRHHQHGGITRFVELGLDVLGEEDGHRPEVQRLQQQLHRCTAPVEEQETALLRTVAQGMEAGAVDGAKVEAGLAALDAAAHTIHACAAPLLDQLHRTLSAPERAALADKVEAHWDVWRDVNHRAVPGGTEPGGRLMALARELALTPEQVDRLAAAAREALAGLAAGLDAERVQRQVLAFCRDFEGERFDASSVTTNSTAALSGFGARRMARFYAAAAPLLTPAQRATLAAHLKEHAEHHREAAAPGGTP